MRIFIRLLAAASLSLTLALVTTGCGKELDAQEETTPKEQTAVPKTATVEVYNNAFKPQTVTIAAGGTITFKSRDVIDYNIVADGIFNEMLKSKATYTATFPNAGTFRVYETMQPQDAEMTVVVK